jgi:hypothetical protein
VQRGERVRFELGFDPTEVGLTFFAPHRVSGGERLAASRRPAWDVDRQGALSLFARAIGRDASYVGCIAFE